MWGVYEDAERLLADVAGLTPEAWAALGAEERAALIHGAERAAALLEQPFYHLFPDETHETERVTLPDTELRKWWARDLYPRHTEFFEAGREYPERAFLSANRVGKTDAGCYEVSAHLTGRYPPWWRGRRFDHPIQAWIAGDTNETVRDIIQPKLLGTPMAAPGQAGRKTVNGGGYLPADCIVGLPTWRQGVADMVETVKVRHASGGLSTVTLKSYQQGRKSFQGTAKHVIWLDEECPEDIYDECLMRTATTAGIIYLTFTPLSGLTPLVQGFLPGGADA